MLTDAGDFVIVDPKLHDEFDAFKKAESLTGHNFVPVNELLLLFCLPQFSSLHRAPRIKKFGISYLELQSSQIDELVLWVREMRKVYSNGESTFDDAVESLWQGNVTGSYNSYIYCVLTLIANIFIRNHHQRQKAIT